MTKEQIAMVKKVESEHKDRAYERAVNELIPIAERMATAELRKRKKARIEKRVGVEGREWQWCNWTVYFHKFMDQLKVERGLIC